MQAPCHCVSLYQQRAPVPMIWGCSANPGACSYTQVKHAAGAGEGSGLFRDHLPRWSCSFFGFSGAVVGTALLPFTKLKFSITSL